MFAHLYVSAIEWQAQDLVKTFSGKACVKQTNRRDENTVPLFRIACLFVGSIWAKRWLSFAAVPPFRPCLCGGATESSFLLLLWLVLRVRPTTDSRVNAFHSSVCARPCSHPHSDLLPRVPVSVFFVFLTWSALRSFKIWLSLPVLVLHCVHVNVPENVCSSYLLFLIFQHIDHWRTPRSPIFSSSPIDSLLLLFRHLPIHRSILSPFTVLPALCNLASL